MTWLSIFGGWLLIGVGSAFCLIGAIGMLRLPDYYSRVHAAGVIDTLGVGAILIGLMLQAGAAPVLIKLILVLMFILATSPTATHALARAALHAGHQPELDEEPTSKT